MHNKYSEGKLFWCFYNRAKTDSKIPGSHRSIKIKLTVVAKIMSMYQLLTLNAIPLRCVSGKIQNANESLHNCTWRKCPKDVFESRTAVVSEINIGYVETLKLNNSGTVGTTLKITHRCDNQRLSQRKRRALEQNNKKREKNSQI
ncbi:uncharacterized protein TNIN_293141 [Trichonephila inaurata madagascariensis]|uniref:Uncharacterized protein n=1 Tax=Trichonephila inaurata madagascariensis TaxID=2747483 RepID=A0A8X6WWC1_9ARAC|nr:uncharacterized protein TNIN_293141 [Trichonephila inaurata madagascariensis]